MKRRILSVALILFTAILAFSEKASYKGTEYSLNVEYNNAPCPGDAVFARMKISHLIKSRERSSLIDKTTARMELYLDGKLLDKADFYVIPSASASIHEITLLAGIPLSSWWTPSDNWKLMIKYCPLGKKQMEITLPFNLTKKDFVTETIPLDDRNTSIKTDTSDRRMKDIEKLNKILGTVNRDSVYQTKAFKSPTTATRRTSFFADRRTFTYTTGGSSTSLHYGTDYGVPEGTKVTACAGGKVVLAEDRVSTGYSVVIEHLPGLYSLYYHMSKLTVDEGDIVKEGELIGLSGCTGLATGPHLHWEMRLNMSAVNPDYFTDNFTFE